MPLQCGTMSTRQLFVAAALLFIAGGCAHVPPPVPQREFRGVWLTTVNNSDWPSRPGLPPDEQKRELIAILDCIAATHLNVVVMHIRPNSDAFYQSDIEPWSDYLSADLGTPPDPYYDPLAFAIEEAHKRGLELHAWLNPYRTRHPLTIPLSSPQHIALQHPEFVHQYGRMWWLDPGEPEVRAYIVRIVRDIVKRYDVDAIHFDDYFYPYPEKDVPFPDDESYAKWNGGLSRDEWRRENVNLLIMDVSRAIKEEKPRVWFGVSPFGIWRPKHPRHVRGLDAYAQIYADSKKWLQAGWVDYLTPQLYWGTQAPQQRFSELLRWWRRQNTLRIHLWPGLGAHRVANGRPNAFTADEIVDQINLIRRGTNDPGWILFTMNVLMRDRGGLADKLEKLNARDVPLPK
jgi:uncharacterized lipoprotein YddW (UPF0748 family)